MAKKETQALERLTPKLSALRKTLRGKERQLLDRMVLGITGEVAVHSAAVKARQSVTKADAKLPEVSLHSAAVGQKIISAKATAAEGRWLLGRIELDASKGVYRITNI